MHSDTSIIYINVSRQVIKMKEKNDSCGIKGTGRYRKGKMGNKSYANKRLAHISGPMRRFLVEIKIKHYV